MDHKTLLVIGGARSGKSRYAQARAEALALEPVYVATAQAFDAEMALRIARHQADRGPQWRTVEAPLALAETIAVQATANRVLLVDCLTLWLTNLILGEHDPVAARAALLDSLRAAAGPIVLVTNEVGLGIVPENALARRFRDEAGWLNQALAAVVDEVQLVTAGLPLRLKGAAEKSPLT